MIYYYKFKDALAALKKSGGVLRYDAEIRAYYIMPI